MKHFQKIAMQLTMAACGALSSIIILYPRGIIDQLFNPNLPRHFMLTAFALFVIYFAALFFAWQHARRFFVPIVALFVGVWIMHDADRAWGVVGGSLSSLIAALIIWPVLAQLLQKPKRVKIFRHLTNPWGIVIVSSAIYITLALLRHLTIRSEAADLGIFTQEVYKYAHFAGIFNTVKGLNIFADHFSPFLMFLAPLWWIWPDAMMLLVVQVVALCVGAWVVYKIADQMFDDRIVSWCIAAAYVLAPSLQAPIDADFHEIIFVPVALLLLFYFQQRQKYVGYWIVFALALLIKENVALYLISWSIFYGLLTKQWKRALIGIVVSAVYFIIVIKGIMPHYTGTGNYIYFKFGALGTSPMQVITTSLKHPWQVVHQFFSFDVPANVGFVHDLKVFTQTSLLAVFGFLPLLAPVAFIFAIPILIEQFLLDFPYHWGLRFHYSTPLTPVLVIACLLGLARASHILSRYKVYELSIKNLQQILAVFVFLSSLAYSVQQRTFIMDIFRPKTYQITSDERQALQVASRIPADASVAANSSIIPHIAGRNVIIRWPGFWGEDGAVGYKNKPLVQDYAILSFAGSHWIWQPDEVVAQMDQAISTPGYGLVDMSEDAKTIVVKRGAQSNQALLQKWNEIKPTLAPKI